MQRNDSLRQTGLTVLTWILAILILCGAGTGAGIAFADEVDSWDDSDVWDDDGSWDDDGNWDDGSWDDDGTWDDDSIWDDDGTWDDNGTWVDDGNSDNGIRDGGNQDDGKQDDGNRDDVKQDDSNRDDDTADEPDAEAYDVKAEAGTGIFQASDESYLREDDKEDPELDEDEYRSFYVNIRNNNPEDQREAPVCYRVDGGVERPFSDEVRRENGTTQYHIDPQEMAALSPGLHEIEVFVDEEPVCTQRLYVERDWDEIMKTPTAEQVESVSNSGRSTYVVFYPQFDESTTGLREYALDFSIDDMDRGTYFSTFTAVVDSSALSQKGLKLDENYGGTSSIYGGFQCLEDGKTGVIMTIWDILGKDAQGNKTVIKAKPLYVDEKAQVFDKEEGSEGEGYFQQFKMEYPWQAQHPYRTLIQVGKNEANGNATATLQVCDLITQEWTKMVTWDLGYPSERILTKNLAGFLENYDTKYCGSVRSANFSNIRGLDAKSGEWVAANSVNFTLNNGVDDFTYVGSYQVGADDSSYYAVTSGVKDLCKPTENMSFSVKNAPSDCPY